MTQSDKGNARKPSATWDVIFAVILLCLLVATIRAGFGFGPIEKGPVAVWLGVYLQAWGVLIFLSYFWRDGSYLLRGIMWLCEQKNFPRGAWTALLLGTFFVGFGATITLIGLGVIGAWPRAV